MPTGVSKDVHHHAGSGQTLSQSAYAYYHSGNITTWTELAQDAPDQTVAVALPVVPQPNVRDSNDPIYV
jgi:hypothetical protein